MYTQTFSEPSLRPQLTSLNPSILPLEPFVKRMANTDSLAITPYEIYDKSVPMIRYDKLGY